MTDLKKIVIDKVNELGGPAKATEFFGKTKATINGWVKTGNIPLSAVELVLNSMQAPPTVGEPEPPQFEPASPAETAKTHEVLDGPHINLSQDVHQLQVQINDLYAHVHNIENFLQGGVPQPQPTSPGYGFRPSPVPNVIIPPGVPLQSRQTNVAVPPPPTAVGDNIPATGTSKPYLPAANSWCQPHQARPASI